MTFTYTSSSTRSSTDSKSAYYALSFYPRDNIFAAAGGRRCDLFGFDSNKRLQAKCAFKDEDEKENFYCVCWTVVEGQIPVICFAGEQGIVKIVDLQLNTLGSFLIGHGGPIFDIQILPHDLDLVATSSKDESVRLWSIGSRRCITVFAGDQGHRDAVLSISIHSSGQWLASSGFDNTIKVWELDAPNVKTAIAQGKASGHHNGALIDNNEKTAATRFRAPFVQFPAFTTRRVHTDYVDCVRWVGDLIMSKSIESSCTLWKPDTRRRPNSVCVLNTYRYDAGAYWFTKFCLNNDSTVMAIGGDTGSITLFDVDSGTKLQGIRHEGLKSIVRDVQFSNDSSILVACCEDGSLWSFVNTEA